MKNIEIITPQFTRTDGTTPVPAPVGPDGFDLLYTMSDAELYALGLRRWGRQEDRNGVEFGPMLWLFPGEWYKSIPTGYEIVDINFNTELFVPGVSDDDIRLGCLPFGILRDVCAEA